MRASRARPTKWRGLLFAFALELPSADQLAVGDQRRVAAVAERRAEDHRPRLVPVELERGEQVDVGQLDDVVAGHNRGCGLGEALHPHHAGEHRGAVDPMIEQERLLARVELGDDRDLAVRGEALNDAPVIGPPSLARAAVARSASSPPVG